MTILLEIKKDECLFIWYDGRVSSVIDGEIKLECETADYVSYFEIKTPGIKCFGDKLVLGKWDSKHSRYIYTRQWTKKNNEGVKEVELHE